MLQNTRLQTNGCQSPKRDDDMNDWCVKTCQDRENYKFTIHNSKAFKTEDHGVLWN